MNSSVRTILVFLVFLCIGPIANAHSSDCVPQHDTALAPGAGNVAHPLPYAQVLVCSLTASGTPCSPTATISSDAACAYPIIQATNPLPAEKKGNFQFYAASGWYQEQMAPPGIQTYSLPVAPGDPTAGPSAAAADSPASAAQSNASGAKIAATAAESTVNAAQTAANSALRSSADDWTARSAAAAAQTTANDSNPMTGGPAKSPAPTVNGVVSAANYSGSDCGQKIATAITAAGSASVTIQVDGSCGPSAWSTFTLPLNDSIQFTGGGTYVVKGITLAGKNSIYADNRATVLLEPNSATQSCILCGTGTHGAPLYYIDVHHIGFINQFCAPNGSGCTTPVTGSSAVNLTYAEESFIQESRFLDFDTSVSLTHPQYFFVAHNYFNGGTTQNLYVYGDGPLYVTGNLLNGSLAGNGVTLVNVSGKLSMNDISRNAQYGVSITATTGLPGGGAADIEATQNTMDSDANSALYLNECWDCVITHNWISSGRDVPGGRPGISANNMADSIISLNKIYWSGEDGIDVNTGTSLAITGNVIGATAGIGVSLRSTTYSSVSNNSCSSVIYAGGGAGMNYCIYEQGSSANNAFFGNTAQGMGTADWAFQSSSTALNQDGQLYGALVNHGTFAEGANGSAYTIRQEVEQTSNLITNCAPSSTCGARITFPKPFPDTSWHMNCSINASSGGTGLVASDADPTSTTQAIVNVYAMSGPLTITEMTCEGFQ